MISFILLVELLKSMEENKMIKNKFNWGALYFGIEFFVVIQKNTQEKNMLSRKNT